MKYGRAVSSENRMHANVAASLLAQVRLPAGPPPAREPADLKTRPVRPPVSPGSERPVQA